MTTPTTTIEALPAATEPLSAGDLIITQQAGVTKKAPVSALGDAAEASVSAHIADTTGAHAATAVAATDSGSGVDGETVQAQLIQLAAGIGDAGSGIVIDDVPPEDTDVLWADTNVVGTEASQTINVFTYTDPIDARPDASVVFWIPDPWDLPLPFAALPGDCVLRSTPNVVAGLNGVAALWQGSAAEYDAIPTPSADTVYFVTADPLP